MKVTSQREKEIFRVTWIGSVVNFLLLIFKFLAGIFGHSAAMLADAVHSLSDFITDIVVIVFVHISGKPEDENHRYGHGKYETLATAIIGVVLFIVGVGLLINGIESVVAALNGKRLESPGVLALSAAVLSILFKEILFRYTIYKGRRLNSQAVTANAWHHRSDVFSSMGTLLGICGAMFLGERWRILDPLAAAVVSVFIMKISIQLIKPCLDELLERALPEEIVNRINEIILSFPEVTSPHNLRTRRIGNNFAIEVHIRMDGELSLNEAHSIATKIEDMLKAEFGKDTHVGIHMEPLKQTNS